MKFPRTIKHFEWALFLIIGYYLFLTFVATTVYIVEGIHLKKLTIAILVLVVILLSIVFSKVLIKLMTQVVYKISSIQIILIYFSLMLFLLVALPLYINLLLSLFNLMPS